MHQVERNTDNTTIKKKINLSSKRHNLQSPREAKEGKQGIRKKDTWRREASKDLVLLPAPISYNNVEKFKQDIIKVKSSEMEDHGALDSNYKDEEISDNSEDITKLEADDNKNFDVCSSTYSPLPARPWVVYMIRSKDFLTEHEARFYMGQILCALKYMSDNRVLHQD